MNVSDVLVFNCNLHYEISKMEQNWGENAPDFMIDGCSHF